jgi:hypothetical protein
MESMYQYEALDMTKCVTRIIRLAGAKNFDAPLYCEMLAVRLMIQPDDQPDKRLQYEAISYLVLSLLKKIIVLGEVVDGLRHTILGSS